jgi:hypothetical protein
MNRFINPINSLPPLDSLRNAHQTRTRQQAQTARDNTRLIRDDVSKQITRDDNPIQLRRALDHKHSRRVNQLVLVLQLWKLGFHHSFKRLPPQPARGKHIRLVQRPHLGIWFLRHGHFARHADDALDLMARVGFRVHSVAGAVVFGALAKVDSAGQFADDGEVDAAADGFFERRGGDERGRGEETGA